MQHNLFTCVFIHNLDKFGPSQAQHGCCTNVHASLLGGRKATHSIRLAPTKPRIHFVLANHQFDLPSGEQVIVKKLKSFLAPSNFTLCSSSTGFLSFSSFTCSWQQDIRCPGVNSLTCCFVICMVEAKHISKTCVTKDVFDFMKQNKIVKKVATGNQGPC